MDRRKLLELYNALNETGYDNPDDLEIYTLENVIYMGVADGEIKGKAKGKAEAVLDLLNDLGTVNDSLRDRILAESDLELLRKWLKMAARAESIEEFCAAMEK
ncbi:MAG: hypothetical protein IJ390_12555 [Lachnospiraceae bacterium]|nr:hypothetical protein [Lachnospiraceae bacterium]